MNHEEEEDFWGTEGRTKEKLRKWEKKTRIFISRKAVKEMNSLTQRLKCAPSDSSLVSALTSSVKFKAG